VAASPAPDDGNLAAGELVTVAFGAGADSIASQARSPHVEGRVISHREDQRGSVTQVVVDGDRLDLTFQIEPVDVAGVELGAETVSLCAHRAGKAGTAHGHRKTGVIVHLPRGHQRTAGQMALDDQGVESCPCRIDRRGVTSGT
jgi:hypothetical protein